MAIWDMAKNRFYRLPQPKHKASIHPSWSPDGSRIAFLRADEGNDGASAPAGWDSSRTLWIMDASGDHLRPINEVGNGILWARWSKDNKNILFGQEFSVSVYSLEKKRAVTLMSNVVDRSSYSNYYVDYMNQTGLPQNLAWHH